MVVKMSHRHRDTVGEAMAIKKFPRFGRRGECLEAVSSPAGVAMITAELQRELRHRALLLGSSTDCRGI